MKITPAPLGICSCGSPGALFSPGTDPVYAAGGILVKRGEPARATCLQCWSAGEANRGTQDMVERVRPREEQPAGYNGPDKAQYDDALGEYEEIRFQQMRWASKGSKLKNRWERKGGDFEDIQHGYRLGKLTPEEQRAMISNRSRVEGWLGIATVTEASGQISFTATFDQPHDELGFRGARLGSRLSLARAHTDGYNTGRMGGSLADCPAPAESEEAHAWAEGYGDGMQDRVERAPRQQKDKSAAEEMAEQAAAMPPSEAEQAVVAEARKARRRAPKLPEPGGSEELPQPLH